jgi:hypothetical protein
VCNEYAFECPACGHLHAFKVWKDGNTPTGPSWTFDGNMEKPTFTPSLRVFNPMSLENGVFTKTACHLNVTAGQIVFHSDCPHALAGKTVPMVDLGQDEEAASEVEPKPVCPVCGGSKVIERSCPTAVWSSPCPECNGV